jgi:PDZ domain-containing protein
MTRRSAASLLALGLLLVLTIVAAGMSVPYVTVSPGRTVDVLGEDGDKPIVRIDGKKTFPPEGELRLTTVSVTNPDARLSLLEAMWSWMRSDEDVLPFEAMYPENSTAEQERAESAAQMVSSQDTAIAVALSELGYELPTHVEVTGVNPGGPSDGKLKPRDTIESVQDRPVGELQQLFDTLAEVEPGDTVEVGVRRGGEPRTFAIRTTAAQDDPGRAVIGVLVGTGYDFPFDVRVGIDESIGGPSAGLIFALSIYDTLTPGSLTGGQVVAGTGTIAPDGTVGPIGGVREKIIGAARDGAELFFVPPANCESAMTAPLEDGGIRLVRADTLHSAVEALEKYAQDPTAELPRCPT